MEQLIIEKLNLVDSGKSTGASYLNGEIIWFSEALQVYIMECDHTGFKRADELVTLISESHGAGKKYSLVSYEFLKVAEVSEIKDLVVEEFS